MNKIIILTIASISLNVSAQYTDNCKFEINCDYENFYENRTLKFNEPSFKGIPQSFRY
jgi:hypothetical protein